MNKNNYRYIDLFAGLGGFHLREFNKQVQNYEMFL